MEGIRHGLEKLGNVEGAMAGQLQVLLVEGLGVIGHDVLGIAVGQVRRQGVGNVPV